MKRSMIDWRAACALALFMAAGSQEASAALPDTGSAGAAFVAGYCTQCHGAPSPSSHSAREWAGVVERMQNWRVTKGFGAIPDRDLGPLLDYLKRHGRTQ